MLLKKDKKDESQADGVPEVSITAAAGEGPQSNKMLALPAANNPDPDSPASKRQASPTTVIILGNTYASYLCAQIIRKMEIFCEFKFWLKISLLFIYLFTR